ncbi:MAG: endonuclease/exonuclease/phosphatase family protein [Pseudomonadota bacterium]
MTNCRDTLTVAVLWTLLSSCASVPPPPPAGTVQVTASTFDGGQCETLQAIDGLPLSDLRITTWNVYKGAKAGWQGELADLDAPNSLLLMQEAMDGTAMLSGLGADKRWHFSPGYETQSGLSGVATSASVNAVERCTLFHREPWLRSPKASLVTRYRLKNSSETLLVANVHAINFTFGTMAFERQLRDVVSLMRGHTGPMVVAGDFNTWSKRRQRMLDDVLAELGVQPVEYNAERVKRVFGNQLDHVYYRGLELRSAEAKPTNSSDHSLLQARFDYVLGQ